MNLQIQEAILHRLQSLADMQQRSVQDMVNEALASYLEQWEVSPEFLAHVDEIIDENRALLDALSKR